MKPLIFYVPALHRLAAPADLPPEAAFFPAGPPGPRSGQAAGEQFKAASGQASGEQLQAAPDQAADEQRRRAETLAASMLPLDFAEAGVMLNDMLSQGEEHAALGGLKQMALLGEAYGQDLSLRAELADLARFAGAGADDDPAGGGHGANDAPDASDANAAPDANAAQGTEAVSASQLAEKTRSALVDCQKVLLLAHYLEERALEIAALGARAMAAEEALLSALGEEEPELFEKPFADACEALKGGPDAAADEALKGGPDAAGGQAADEAASFALSFGVSWRTVLDAVLAFLPEEAVLLTFDPGMICDLQEDGLLRPVPAERVPFSLPGSPLPEQVFFYAGLPAWRLAGRRGPLAERPWLERTVELYAVLPASAALDGKKTVNSPGLLPDKDA